MHLCEHILVISRIVSLFSPAMTCSTSRIGSTPAVPGNRQQIMIYVNKFDDGTGDLSRERKDSFYWYKKVIETNGEDLG